MVFKTMSSANIRYATAGSSPAGYGTVVTDTGIAFFQLDGSELGYNPQTVAELQVRALNFTFNARDTNFVFNDASGATYLFGIDGNFNATS